MHYSTGYLCQILLQLAFFFYGCLKNAEISNFKKMRSVRAEFFNADGQTDLLNPTVAFRNFAKAL
jgi:hypothetical protein